MDLSKKSSIREIYSHSKRVFVLNKFKKMRFPYKKKRDISDKFTEDTKINLHGW